MADVAAATCVEVVFCTELWVDVVFEECKLIIVLMLETIFAKLELRLVRVSTIEILSKQLESIMFKARSSSPRSQGFVNLRSTFWDLAILRIGLPTEDLQKICSLV